MFRIKINFHRNLNQRKDQKKMWMKGIGIFTPYMLSKPNLERVIIRIWRSCINLLKYDIETKGRGYFGIQGSYFARGYFAAQNLTVPTVHVQNPSLVAIIKHSMIYYVNNDYCGKKLVRCGCSFWGDCKVRQQLSLLR